MIDNILTIPANVTSTLLAANLTAALGAVRQAGVEDVLNTTPDLTVFVPTNDAFAAIGNLVSGLTAEQLGSILGYHVIPGQVIYSSDIADGSVATLEGSDLNIKVQDGNVFVNSAKVIAADILIANGVAHVIDGYVLQISPQKMYDQMLMT